MTKDELANLLDTAQSVVDATDLVNKTPRTLLYGYTCERHSWHVYLGEDQKIHLMVYTPTLLLKSADGFTANQQFIPDKRLYPESCDAEFCALLMRADEILPFTAFTEGAHESRTQDRIYAGLTREELEPLRTKRLTCEDLQIACTPVWACMALKQAAIEEKASHEDAYLGIEVKLCDVEAILARTCDILPRLLDNGGHVPQKAKNYADSAISHLGARPGTHVLDASWTSGLMRAEVETGHDSFVKQSSLEKLGYTVEAYGNGLCLRKAVIQPLSGQHYLAALCPLGARPGEPATQYYYLERVFGSEEAFFSNARMYAGPPFVSVKA